MRIDLTTEEFRKWYMRIASIENCTRPCCIQLEMKRIFEASWVYVAHISEVSEPGDYKATYIGVQPVIINRNANSVKYKRCSIGAGTEQQ